MTPSALLADLEAAGVLPTREGADLRYRTRRGVSIAPCRDRIAGTKPAILAELRLRERIVAAATAATAAFDRAEYDRLWAEWHAHQENAP